MSLPKFTARKVNHKMQTIKKHTFKKIEDGQEYTAHAYGENLAEVYFSKNAFDPGSGYEYVGTEEVAYLYIELAEMIAQALTAKWIAYPQSDEHANCNWNLQRYDGVTLYLTGPRYGGMDKFHFGASLPRDNGSYVEPRDEQGNKISVPEIGCSVKKSPEQMAKEIERRLLPQAELAHDAVLKQIAHNNSNRAAQAVAIDQIADAAEVNRPKVNYSNQRPIYVDGLVMTVSPAGESVQLTGYVDIDKAIRIAAVLAKGKGK